MLRTTARGVVLCILLLQAFLIHSVFAQSNARLWGTVTDPSGAVVPGADVTVRNQGTGTEYTTKTNEAGLYEMPSLAVGTYRVEVRASGMQAEAVTGLVLDISQNVRRDFKLTVGSSTVKVEVSGAAPVVESSTVEVGQVIDQKTTQEIPLNGRHFVDLSLLTPGTVTPPANGFLTAPLRGQGSFSFVTAGQREDTVNFMINGVNLNDIVDQSLLP